MTVKRSLVSVLILMLCLCAMPVSAFAAASSDLSYVITFDDGAGVEITGCDTSAQGDLVIPDKILNIPVTSIYSGAFEGCTKLTSITIPATVDYLTANMFDGCTSLTAINVGAGNEEYQSIDGVLFATNFISYYMILEDAYLDMDFSDLWGLALLCCPEGKSGSYTVPDGVKYVEMYAFDDCAKLTDITFPASILYMEDTLLDGCKALTGFSINPSCAYYSSTDGMLLDKNAETLLRCPQAKAGAVAVPAGVKTVGDNAFDSCAAITSVALPDSVAFLTNLSFFGCTSLTAFSVGAENAAYSIIDGVLFNKNADTLICCPVGYAGDYTVPAGVTAIGEGAFYGCAKVTGVTLPAGLTAVGSGAFASCTGLTAMTIPAGVTDIGYAAFSGCTSLKSVTMYEGVVSIWDYAFGGCTALSSVKYPDSVTWVGYGTLDGTAYYKNTSNWETTGLYNNKCLIEASSTLLGRLTVKSGTVCVAGGAAEYGTITALTLPDSVVSVGDEAFSGCDKLTSVTFSKNLKTLGYGVFMDCTKLSAITLPDGITSIGYGLVMYTAYDDNEANWKNGLLYIGNYLVDVDYSVEGNITIPDGTVLIADGIFSGTEITGVTLPGSVLYIGAGAFESCRYLENVSLSEGIKSVGAYAFLDCESLTFVRVPESVSDIGPYAFGFASEYASGNPLGEYVVYDFVAADGFTLGCYQDSAAHKYALEYDVPFCLLENGGTTLTLLYGKAFELDRAAGQLLCVEDGLTAGSLTDHLNGGNIVVVDAAGKTLSAGDLVGTGCEVRLTDGGAILDKLTVIVLGDTNGDGLVQITDARQTLRVAARLDDFATDAQKTAADVVGFDGIVDAADARLLLRVGAGLATLDFPELA